MEEKQFSQIERWFLQLNRQIEDSTARLDLKIENRFNALFTVCTNIRKDIEGLKAELKLLHETRDKFEARISVLELALKELERRLSH
ncbi:MAG: hypothetical protein HYU99_01740 [Deltaproteobacteria bacterium]|nr:hypothetical protein [Deltaproteobacteria bacterium]